MPLIKRAFNIYKLQKHSNAGTPYSQLTFPFHQLQDFLGFLDQLKCVQQAEDVENFVSPFPPRQRKRFEFYVPAGAGQFKRVGVSVHTTGGDCRNVVQRSLIELFAQCGMLHHVVMATVAFVLLAMGLLVGRFRKKRLRSA